MHGSAGFFADKKFVKSLDFAPVVYYNNIIYTLSY